MRIGVPTNDGKTISEHFGRSAAFLVFEIEDGQIKACETRKNGMQHLHEQRACDHAATGSTPHTHEGILSALAGCDVVICAGMGRGAAEALRAGGVGRIVVTAAGPAEEIVAAYLAGKLAPGTKSFCHCSH